jgi:hypothetical protein
MKAVLISDLMRCPQLWHELIPLGTLRGGELILDDALATRLNDCPETVPTQDWPFQPPMPAPQPTGNKLPDSVRVERLAICANCEHNQNGLCAKCPHCGGRNIEYKVQAVFEFCPLSPPKWSRWIQPKELS